MSDRQSGGRFGALGGAALLAVAWLAATAWMRPLAVPDEGRYVGVAWEMLRSGNWLVPTLDGFPYFHKPPLFYWITAASLWLFGMNEWAARLAPLLGAAAAATALYRFSLRWAGPGNATAALLVLATQPLFFLAAQFSNLDMLVAGCIAVTVLALADVVLQAERGQSARGALALAYLFAGLGLLAKGLIGVVLPGMVVVVWLLALRRPRQVLSLLWPPGIALFLGVTLPWFLAMQWRFAEFANYFFVVQHFKRFAQAGFNNSQAFWFYPAALALATLPWFPWLATAARKAYWADPVQGPVRKLMWIWLFAVTLFFSLPESKIIGYLLPVTVPLAYLIGDGASQLVQGSSRLRLLWQSSALVAIAGCLAGVLWATANPGKPLRGLGRELASRAGPQEPVVFLHDYFFDIGFYAKARGPSRVVEDWDSPEVEARDNWGKELLDARRFADDAAASMLLSPAALPALACASSTTWLLGNYKIMPRYPMLAHAAEIARNGETVLWRLPGQSAAFRAAHCAENPVVKPARGG